MDEQQNLPEKKPQLKGLARLKRDLKGMTFTEKVSHLWTYYRWIIIVVIMSMLLISILTTTYINANTKLLLGGVGLNVDIDDTARAYMTDEFEAKHGTGLKWEDAEYAELILRSGPNSESYEERQYNIVNIHSLIAAKNLDYVVGDLEGILCVWTQEEESFPFLRMDQIFTAQELEVLGDQQRLLIDEASGAAVGIDITDLPLVQKHFGTQEKVYFCIIKNSPRLELVRAFYDHLTAWKE